MGIFLFVPPKKKEKKKKKRILGYLVPTFMFVPNTPLIYYLFSHYMYNNNNNNKIKKIYNTFSLGFSLSHSEFLLLMFLLLSSFGPQSS